MVEAELFEGVLHGRTPRRRGAGQLMDAAPVTCTALIARPCPASGSRPSKSHASRTQARPKTGPREQNRRKERHLSPRVK
eukprot:7656-Eustigmatos_ZCMA.PRE.1